jgi:hypothetical protein
LVAPDRSSNHAAAQGTIASLPHHRQQRALDPQSLICRGVLGNRLQGQRNRRKMGATAGEFIQELTRDHDVIVIGGLAIIAHGFNRPTKDADVWLDPLESS